MSWNPELGRWDLGGRFDSRDALVYVVWCLPAVSYLPLLTLPIPAFAHPYREIAGAFQALAYARDGFMSLTYATPQENLSGLHLHSLLSAPLVEVGYVEGGRLVSLLSALLAVVLLGYVATRLFDWRIGLVAPLFLWTNPLFSRFAFSFKPEALSIALTLAVIFLLVRYDDTAEAWYWYGVLALLPVATTVHLWEASIALPVVVVLVARRQFTEALVTAGVTAASIGAVYVLAGLKPTDPGSLASAYGTHADGNWTLLFKPEWWFYWWPTDDPLAVGTAVERVLLTPEWGIIGLVLPVSLGLFAFWSYRAIQTRGMRELLVASWFASGLAIPVGLAAGFLDHEYYLWPLLAPVALTGSLGAVTVFDHVTDEFEARPTRTAATVLLALLVVFASIGFVFQGPYAVNQQKLAINGTTGFDLGADRPYTQELREAGAQLRQRGVSDPSAVTLVGEFEPGYVGTSTSRLLIQAGIVVRERHYGDAGPTIVSNRTAVGACEAVVVREGSDLSVSECR